MEYFVSSKKIQNNNIINTIIIVIICCRWNLEHRAVLLKLTNRIFLYGQLNCIEESTLEKYLFLLLQVFWIVLILRNHWRFLRNPHFQVHLHASSMNFGVVEKQYFFFVISSVSSPWLTIQMKANALFL